MDGCMKKLLIAALLFSNLSIADERLKDAPMEWLISATIQSKLNHEGHDLHDHGHSDDLANDELLREIFETVTYDTDNDELILSSSLKTLDLRMKLESFLSTQAKNNRVDEKYTQWLDEGKAQYDVTLYRTNFAPEGFYYLNHIHTNLSKDNSELKWLKYSPQKTYSLINNLIKRRYTKAAVAFNDHDTDRAYDMVKDINYPSLYPLRSIEWGGSTHMGLVGIKENWDNLDNGRNYSGEESIRQSRSSDGFRIVNHPNRKNKPFPYASWLDANGVEVWNSIVENSPFLIFKIERSYNRDAFQQWVDSMKTGKTYTAVGGSDFHFMIPCLRDRTLMYPGNYIPAENIEQTEEYLQQGRVSFVTRPTAPKLTLQAKFEGQNDWANMGDKVQGNKKLTVQLFGDFSDTNKRIGGFCYNTVRNFYRLLTFWKKRFWEIRFYNLEGDLIAKRSLNPKWYRYNRHFRATFDLDVQGTDLIRAELWEVNKRARNVDLLGATNPIYINW